MVRRRRLHPGSMRGPRRGATTQDPTFCRASRLFLRPEAVARRSDPPELNPPSYQNSGGGSDHEARLGADAV